MNKCGVLFSLLTFPLSHPVFRPEGWKGWDGGGGVKIKGQEGEGRGDDIM